MPEKKTPFQRLQRIINLLDDSPKTCSFKGCDETGEYEPQIVIPRLNDLPMTIILEIRVCERHRREPKRAFLSDDGMRHLTQLLKSHGYERPDASQMRLQFESKGGLVIPHK